MTRLRIEGDSPISARLDRDGRDGAGSGRPTLSRLERAAGAWAARGDARPLARWLDRELDGQGLPRRLGPSAWWDVLERLAESARVRDGDWPAELDARVERLAGVAAGFLGDGRSPWRPGVEASGRAGLLRFWAGRLADPILERLARGRSPTRLGSFVADRGPLAALRGDPSGPRDPGGDVLAIDHLSRPGACSLELIGRGRPWLGPSWEPGPPGATIGPARTTARSSGPKAEVVEWTFRVGDDRVVRTVALLKGVGLALIADEFGGRGEEARLRVDLASGVVAAAIEGSRGLALEQPGSSARAWPIGLPWRDYPTDRGAFAVEGPALTLRHARSSRRCWLPVLLSWDPSRNRRPASWRVLTVSERSRVCPPDVAFAARVGWGTGRDGLVIYRSLARPATRAFLGHQTGARLLIGLFTPAGDVVPLARLD